MDKKEIAKMVFPTLLMTLSTVPALAGTVDRFVPGRGAQEEKPKAAIMQEAVKQELIQVLGYGESSTVTLNVAGEPGTFFRVMASPSGAEESYRLVSKGEGVTGKNGMGSVSLDLGALGKEEVYIKVITSDDAEFSDTRYTPNPLVLCVEPMMLSGSTTDAVNKKLKEEVNKLREEVHKKMREQKVRTPSAVAAVRG